MRVKETLAVFKFRTMKIYKCDKNRKLAPTDNQSRPKTDGEKCGEELFIKKKKKLERGIYFIYIVRSFARLAWINDVISS